MKAVYRLPVRQGIVIPVPDGTPPISFFDTDSFGDTKVSWKADSKGHLEFVELNIFGAQIQHAPNGAILSSYPELEEFAFRVIAYVANSILIQTGFDAFDPANVLRGTPEIFPETSEEEVKFAKCPKTVGSAFTVDALISGNFRPMEYSAGFGHSAAVASYADGLRVSSPFQQYEQFYKVVGHFFTQEGPDLDKAVSSHASRYDPKYNQAQVEKLRDLRNRCVHPKHSHGHVNPEDVASIREVKSALPIMRALARLLLCHPPA